MRRWMMMRSNKDENEKYLTITCVQNEASVEFSEPCFYSVNKVDWIQISGLQSLSEGEIRYYKNVKTPTSTDGCGKFSIAGYCHLSGNCMSMIYGDDADKYDHVPDYGFYKLFANCDGIVSVDEDFLPANSVGAHAYESMFDYCANLITPPKLNAMVLGEQCYRGTFYNCSSIQEFSILPATELANGCYYYMFGNCYSLKTPPILPAIELKKQCYYSMFFACESLEIGPNLPALVLEDSCYYQMFYNCSNLKEITMLATSIDASKSMYNWMKNVHRGGVFYKNKDAQWTLSGDNGVPLSWSIIYI